MDNAGGTSNTPFCSKSACHGSVWKYVSFNAQSLRTVLQEQLIEASPTPTPTPTPEVTTAPAATQAGEASPTPSGEELALTYAGAIGPIFQQRCGVCHGGQGVAMNGLNLTTYQTLMIGGIDGLAITPGDPDNSQLFHKIAGAQPHFAQLTPQELDLVKKWIAGGAPEK
jgi:mono/diheme cytochrome c family protein